MNKLPPPPNYPSRDPQIPSNIDHTALNRGTLGVLVSTLRETNVAVPINWGDPLGGGPYNNSLGV